MERQHRHEVEGQEDQKNRKPTNQSEGQKFFLDFHHQVSSSTPSDQPAYLDCFYLLLKSNKKLKVESAIDEHS